MRALLTAMLFLPACKHAGAPTSSVEVGGNIVTIEIADEPGERARGLMHRKELGEDDGMLFVYPDARPLSFWMENTSIPLSIAYLTPEGAILNIEDMVPFDRDSVPSEGPALYALEVNRGWFERHKVGVGDVVTGLPGPSAR